ncbi:hypothetical protein EMCRGX_G009419 [Ephydatia muelleri]
MFTSEVSNGMSAGDAEINVSQMFMVSPITVWRSWIKDRIAQGGKNEDGYLTIQQIQQYIKDELLKEEDVVPTESLMRQLESLNGQIFQQERDHFFMEIMMKLFCMQIKGIILHGSNDSYHLKPKGEGASIMRTWFERMKRDELRTLLANQPDFASVKPELQELVEERGHILLFGPKCHPECMHIEMCWAHVKQYCRQHCGNSIVALRKSLECALSEQHLSCFLALLEDDHRVEAPALGSPLGAFLCPSVAQVRSAPCDALRRGLHLDDAWF